MLCACDGSEVVRVSRAEDTSPVVARLPPGGQLRPTEEADLISLSELYRERFGHPLTVEEWRWKYRQVPGKAISLVALDGAGRVVAHAGAVKLPAEWNAGAGGIWQLTDFLGSTRGAGLKAPLVMVGQELLRDLPRPEDAPWIFGFPSQRHFLLGEKVFGYGPLAKFHELEGELYAPAASAQQSPVTIEVSDHCESWVEEVWRACKVSGVIRTAGFLNWRYWARPGRYYRFYRLRGPGGEGLAVFAFVGSEARAAELWLPANRGLESGLSVVADDLLTTGLERWRFWPSVEGAAGRALEPLQLVARGEIFVGYRGREGGEDPRRFAEGFVYSMGDYDIT